LEEKEQLNHSRATTKNKIREDELEKKICYITQSFSQNYFKNQLQKISKKKCKKC
jgi:hypothetical protein